MSDRTALLRSVLERPEDDIPRLVIADHYEENGEPERGEFIRVQVELEELSRQQDQFLMADISPRDYDRVIVTKRQEELRRRELQILSPADWNVPVAGWGWTTRELPNSRGQSVVQWSRGFVSAVRCRLADWVGGERCARCHGTGEFEKHEHNYRCGRCSGTGRTPAHGPRIVAEQPVERAEVVDKRPWQNSLNEGPVRFTWLTTELVDARSAGNRDRLPPAIFEILYPRATYRGIVQAGFDSEAAAQSALSLALLNWARREAGLPPLRAVEVATV